MGFVSFGAVSGQAWSPAALLGRSCWWASRTVHCRVVRVDRAGGLLHCWVVNFAVRLVFGRVGCSWVGDGQNRGQSTSRPRDCWVSGTDGACAWDSPHFFRRSGLVAPGVDVEAVVGVGARARLAGFFPGAADFHHPREVAVEVALEMTVVASAWAGLETCSSVGGCAWAGLETCPTVGCCAWAGLEGASASRGVRGCFRKSPFL